VELVQWDDPAQVLEDGDELEIWSGPQGGWHVFFGLRIRSASPRVNLTLTADALEKRVVDSNFDLRLREYRDCEGTLEAVQGFLDIWELQTETEWSAPQILGGESIDVTVLVETEEGPTEDRLSLLGVGEEASK
jgi:hypothetical protein